MASTVTRTARDVRDGDELVISEYSRTTVEEDLALVLEKTLGEDDRVTLLISVPADMRLVTLPRPREEVDPFETSETED